MMTVEEFVQKSGAEIVADNLIVGVMDSRKKVGSIEGGTFTLNDEGQKILAELEGRAPAQADEAVVEKKSRKQ